MTSEHRDHRPRVVHGKAGTSTEGRAFIATAVPESVAGDEVIEAVEARIRDAGGTMLRESGKFRIWGFPRSMPVPEIEALCDRLPCSADPDIASVPDTGADLEPTPGSTETDRDAGNLAEDPAAGPDEDQAADQDAAGVDPRPGPGDRDREDPPETTGLVAASDPDDPGDGADGWCFDISQAPRGTWKSVAGKAAGRENAIFERQVHVREKVFAAGSGGVVTVSWWLPDEERWCMFAKEVPPLAWMPWEENAPLPQHPNRMGQSERSREAPVPF